ncbi:hypothetical protein M433DRAFT_137101 [Acidomyces richmondensis BFW]|nr:hypothetical protein M433DRAFT_137101 [Acidomyces richmondensis BFW]
MAHTARLDALAEKLVTTTTHISQNDARFQALRRIAVHGISDQRHVRTNPFTVQRTLAGLLEKFIVLNRDDLAEALQDRLDQLPSSNKWLPDILAFLLQLSHRPTEETHLEDVKALGLPLIPRCEVTWEQILAEDPLDEEGIWDNVDRGYHSSGDDTTVNEELHSEHTTSTNATSVNEDLLAIAKLHLTRPDPSLLDDIVNFRKHCQLPANPSEVQILSELTLIREIIAMMNGLPSLLHQRDEASHALHIRAKITVEGVGVSTMRSLLNSCVRMGTNLDFLRRWCACKQKVAHLESIQAAVEKLLGALQRELAALERSYVYPSMDTCVSIIKVFSELEQLVRPLTHLSTLIWRHQKFVSDGMASFSFLNALYDQVCMSHLSGDGAFAAVAKVLWASFDTYLRPLNNWIQSGSISSEDSDNFFIIDAKSDCVAGKMWHDRFSLRTSKNGETFCPKFIAPFVHRIVTIGKTKAFMRLLDPAVGIDSVTYGNVPFLPTFDDVQRQIAEHPCLPFPQLIEDILDKWLISAETSGKCIIRDTLMENYGLRSYLMAMPYVFFARDGTLFQSFAETVFRRISYNSGMWQGDSFLLTELAQNTIGNAPGVDTESIAVLLQPQGEGSSQLESYVTQKLSTLRLKYAVSWPVQNIIEQGTQKVLSAIFVFLLQIYHIKFLLSPELFSFRMCRSAGFQISKAMAAAIQLRFRLICFVDILIAHITTTTSSQSQMMRSQMESADSIDSMANIWTAYVQRLETVLLLSLNLKSINSAIISILVSGEQFANIWRNFIQSSPTCSQEISSLVRAHSQNVDISTVEQAIDKHFSFAVAGLRAVSRASGVAALEALAERLEWNGG